MRPDASVRAWHRDADHGARNIIKMLFPKLDANFDFTEKGNLTKA